jgi:ABC-2 type transport system ATP-binding protein
LENIIEIKGLKKKYDDKFELGKIDISIPKGKKVLQKSRDEIIDNYGILKCDIDYFPNIDKKDIVTYKKTKYSYEILISNKEQLTKKYNKCIIDKITLEDLMLLIIKGEKIC